jgi:CrcB protein
MGMESPETARMADDSYRVTLAVGFCLEPPQGRFFAARTRRKGKAMGFLIVFLGGGIGAALRHGVNIASARLLGTAFPYATMIENVTGSLAMGFLAGYFAFRSGGGHQHWQLFLTTGILGGYTTFSAFSLDAVLLYERGAFGLGALYALGSVVLAIGGLIGGLALARHVL